MKTINFFRIIPVIVLTVFMLNSCAENKKQTKQEESVQTEAVKEQKTDESGKTVQQKDTPEVRFKKKYHSFDLNEDGKVSKDEFQKRSFAEFTEKDKNKDGKLDKTECGGLAMLNPEGNPVDRDTFVKLRGERFDDMDADKDGFMSEEDFVSYKMAFMKKMKAKKEAAEQQ